MKRRNTLIALVSSLAVMLTVLLSGCGSAAPADHFVPADDIRHALSVDPSVGVTPASAAPAAPAQRSKSEYIGLDKARSIALQRAGVSSADVRWEESDFDPDDGVPVYELEFRAKGYEYSCDVHAITGAVLDYDAERDD